MKQQIIFATLLFSALAAPHHGEEHDETDNLLRDGAAMEETGDESNQANKLETNAAETPVGVKPQYVVPVYFPQPVQTRRFVQYIPFYGIPPNFTPEDRNINANAGFNLGPIGAGFGAGIAPGQLYFGAGGGYSGGLYRPYNYQEQPYYTNYVPATVIPANTQFTG